MPGLFVKLAFCEKYIKITELQYIHTEEEKVHLGKDHDQRKHFLTKNEILSIYNNFAIYN